MSFAIYIYNNMDTTSSLTRVTQNNTMKATVQLQGNATTNDDLLSSVTLYPPDWQHTPT